MEETEKRRLRGRIDEETKRQVIELYRQGLSERKVGRELGISNVRVHRILVRNNKPRRSVMKYPKTNFSGGPAEQARILGFIEDCGARYHRRHIRVHTSTTHPAQIRLFNIRFGGYGHVGMTPSYNKPCSTYEWRFWIDLNGSFDFLPQYKKNPMTFLVEIAGKGYEIVRTASLINAEGSMFIDANNGHPRVAIQITNNNRMLLEFTQMTLGGRVVPNKDGYQLRLEREQAIEALRRLPVTHEEKAAAKELILHYADNGGIGKEALWAYRELRRRIDDEVRLCTLQARLEYIRRHGRPHPDDPDQTIPTD